MFAEWIHVRVRCSRQPGPGSGDPTPLLGTGFGKGRPYNRRGKWVTRAVFSAQSVAPAARPTRAAPPGQARWGAQFRTVGNVTGGAIGTSDGGLGQAGEFGDFLEDFASSRVEPDCKICVGLDSLRPSSPPSSCSGARIPASVPSFWSCRMLTRAKKAVRTAAVVALGGLSVWTVAAERVRPGGERSAQLFRYQQPGGESYFALAIRPEGLAAGPARDHVLLIDTSASQVGQHRRQAMAVVRELLAALPATDRVRLYAVDSALEALQASFAQPQSAEVDAALAKLTKRVPLGASDLRPALAASLETLAGDRAGSIIYVGDGMSTAGIVQTEEMRDLVATLRDRQVPVHSYAVGPRIDHRLLGVLAEHTGGVLMLDELIDDAKVTPAELGGRLARAATAPVLYPESLTVTPAVDRILPQQCPPLRPDRDSILLGRGETADSVQVTAMVGGQTLQWTVQPSASQRGNTYLTRLWSVAESDDGLSVAVAGTELLHQALEEFERDIALLTAAGQRAIQTRNLKDAEEIAWAIRQADPENTQA
ncbi:MAG TPA: hypothetical protein DDY91_07060, partial [Planctomycetaceae bacterium]|nr:hypothetical protein [Planctomycetaceae bacterium]